jgi:hypothetical protein
MAPADLVSWLIAAVGGIVLCGVAAGAADAWRDARGGGALAYSGPLFHFDGALVVLVFAPGVLGFAWGFDASVRAWGLAMPVLAWPLLGLASLVSIFTPVPRSARGALAGAACACVPVLVLLELARAYLPIGTGVGLGTWVPLVALALGALGGWSVGAAAAGTPADARIVQLAAGSYRWIGWLRDAAIYWLRAMRPQLKKIAWWGVGLGIGSAALGLVTSLEELVGVGLAFGVFGLAPLVLSQAAEFAVAFAVPAAAPARLGLSWFIAVATVARVRSRSSIRRALVLARYPRALCDSCLRTDAPLASAYAEGVRTCSKCGEAISFEGGAGRLVVVFEDTDGQAGPRVFVRRAQDLVDADRAVDVTDVRLGDAFAEHEVERLVAFLKQRPPAHPLRRIEVFAASGARSVRPYLRNILADHFRWAEVDPIREPTTPAR